MYQKKDTLQLEIQMENVLFEKKQTDFYFFNYFC